MIVMFCFGSYWERLGNKHGFGVMLKYLLKSQALLFEVSCVQLASS